MKNVEAIAKTNSLYDIAAMQGAISGLIGRAIVIRLIGGEAVGEGGI